MERPFFTVDRIDEKWIITHDDGLTIREKKFSFLPVSEVSCMMENWLVRVIANETHAVQSN